MTTPDICVQLGNQSMQSGWMLSRDTGWRRIIDTIPRSAFRRIIVMDPLPRAPVPQQHRLEYALNIFRRDDYDAYRADFAEQMEAAKQKTGEFPDVYVGGFHTQRYWAKQLANGTIANTIDQILKLFRKSDDPHSELLARTIAFDGEAMAWNGNWREACCNVVLARGYPMGCNAAAGQTALFASIDGPQYVEDWIELADEERFYNDFGCWNRNIVMLALTEHLTRDDIERWVERSYGIAEMVGSFANDGSLPARWARVQADSVTA